MKISKTMDERKEKMIVSYIILIQGDYFKYNIGPIYRTHIINGKSI